jgi:hypothetical protein
MKIAIYVFVSLSLLTLALKGRHFCFAVGFDWTERRPYVWQSHGGDYASAYRGYAGRDALFRAMVDDYERERKK